MEDLKAYRLLTCSLCGFFCFVLFFPINEIILKMLCMLLSNPWTYFLGQQETGSDHIIQIAFLWLRLYWLLLFCLTDKDLAYLREKNGLHASSYS